jgi:IS1 family transposase
MNSWLFPPRTREVQLDEKWSFVSKKQEHCDPTDPADDQHGDWWDHVAYDAEHRLVLCVVPGARGAEEAEAVVADLHRRTEGRPVLITSDAYPTYADAILHVYGEPVEETPTGRPARRMVPERVPPPGLTYATVEKRRRLGRVVEVLVHLIFGTMAALASALRRSRVSRRVNVSFLERQNATDRHRNARKGRKTYRFSKSWDVHAAMTCFTLYASNFGWPVRPLRQRGDGGWWQRTPAMAAGLAAHVWTAEEWLTLPAVQR